MTAPTYPIPYIFDKKPFYTILTNKYYRNYIITQNVFFSNYIVKCISHHALWLRGCLNSKLSFNLPFLITMPFAQQSNQQILIFFSCIQNQSSYLEQIVL